MKFKFITSVAFSILSLIAFGQVTTGKISYDVKLSSDNPQMTAYISQMENSMLEIYFVGDKSRTDFYMGEMSTTNTVSSKDNDTTLVLLDNMFMGKVALKVTEDETEDNEMMNASKVRSVEIVEGESKEIIGYKCKKAIVTFENDFVSEVWYTEDIVPGLRGGQFLFDEIKGLPLEMNSKSFGMDMQMEAYEFKGKLSKKDIQQKFSFDIPKGYTLKTAEDLKQMQGGGR